jgi:hypothetical protein
LRFPVALLFAGVITVAMFTTLHALIRGRGGSEAALAMPKVEFVRLKRSVEIGEEARKVERVKPGEADPADLAVAEGVNLGLDVRHRRGPRREFRLGGGGRWGRPRRAKAFNSVSAIATRCRSCASSGTAAGTATSSRAGCRSSSRFDRRLGEGRGRREVEPPCSNGMPCRP